MKRALLLVVVASCVVVLAERSAHACTCIPLTDPKDVLRRSDGAFVGTFVGASTRLPYRNNEFKVHAVYKGEIASEIVVRSGRDSAACGIAARAGDQLGLFLERNKGVWTSSSCSQVTPADMRKTGAPPSVPIDAPGVPPRLQGANAVPVEAIWTFAAAMLLLTFALMLARQRAAT